MTQADVNPDNRGERADGLWASAEAAKAALVEKFQIGAQSFRIVPVEYPYGDESLVVVLATVQGLHRGSWNQIMSAERDEEFEVEFAGGRVDTRYALGWDEYRAMVSDLKANHAFALPDSEEAAGITGEPQTMTLLTGVTLATRRVYSGEGERPLPTLHVSPDAVPVAYVRDGEPRHARYDRDSDDRELRFRPGLIVSAALTPES